MSKKTLKNNSFIKRKNKTGGILRMKSYKEILGKSEKERNTQLELLETALKEATEQKLKLVHYSEFSHLESLELHFEDEQTDIQTVEEKAKEVIEKWTLRHEMNIAGIMVYWKNGILTFRFPTDEIGNEHFKYALRENKSNIIF